ncbi:MAG: acyl-CoA dehydrogenase family protein [Thermoanaerobaculia bacterium]
MDFELSKAEKLLQSSVTAWLARTCPPARVRALIETPGACDEALWEGLAEQGWTSLTLGEKVGGMGLGAVQLAAVAEAMGAACLPGPWLATVWASAVLAAADEDRHADLLGAVVEGKASLAVGLLEESARWDAEAVGLRAVAENGGLSLSGTKLFVDGAMAAGTFLLAVREGGELVLVLVPREAPGVTVVPAPAIDLTRPIARVDLKDVRVDAAAVVARGEAAKAALAAGTRLATVAICAELVGGMGWALADSVEYAKTRQQFGRPIGAFQAVQFMCAEMLVRVESARSIAYAAAWAVGAEDPAAERLLAAAKTYCSDAAREVGNLAVQLHGGIGFTWEHDLNLYYRRFKGSEIAFGDATFHRETVARLVIDPHRPKET